MIKEQIKNFYIESLNDDLAPNVFAEQILSFLCIEKMCITPEEIDIIINEDVPKNKDFKKYTNKEKSLIIASTKAGAKWFRNSIIEGNYH